MRFLGVHIMKKMSCLRQLLTVFALVYALQNTTVYAQAVGEPEFSSSGIVSSLSGQTGKLAPGSLITIKGTNLSGTGLTCQAPTDKQLPLELCGTVVSTDEIFDNDANNAFRLFSVSPEEIKLQVSYSTPARRQDLCVLHGKLAEAGDDDMEFCEEVVVKKQAPVIATTGTGAAGTSNFAVAFHKDGKAITTEAPALIGERFLLTATGLGASRPATADGSPAVANAKISKKPKAYLYAPDGKKVKVTVVDSEKLEKSVGLDNLELTVPRVPGVASDKVTNYQLQIYIGLRDNSNKAPFPIIGREVSGTLTPTPTPTNTPTRTPTVTPTGTLTPTPTVTPTGTLTPTPTVTPSTGAGRCIVPSARSFYFPKPLLQYLVYNPATELCLLEEIATGLETACPATSKIFCCGGICWIK